MSEEERMDIVEGVDEEGIRLLLRVDRYFYYNGEEYVLLSDDVEGTKPLEDATLYVMKVSVSKDEEGEEIEDFDPVEPELMDSLIEVIKTNYNGGAADALEDEE